MWDCKNDAMHPQYGMVGQSSHERMLRVLDLIEESATPLTSDDMADRLGFTRSTLYRHLKNLSDAGLVTSFPDVGYVLGPRVAELNSNMPNAAPPTIPSPPLLP